jgi:carbonic anhydrase
MICNGLINFVLPGDLCVEQGTTHAEKLIEGFQAFRKETYKGDSALMPRLVAEGQSPDYFIISCIDSRSNPGTIFRPDPGTFFAHKAMGAIVRPYKQGTALAAALQFALMYNKVKEIIVLGHTGCGAVKAMVEELEDPEISSFINVAREGLEKAKECCAGVCSHDELLRHAEEQIVLLSAENLKTYPSVAKALEENHVSIRPWLFEMENGNLLEFNENEFINLTQSVQSKQK